MLAFLIAALVDSPPNTAAAAAGGVVLVAALGGMVALMMAGRILQPKASSSASGHEEHCPTRAAGNISKEDMMTKSEQRLLAALGYDESENGDVDDIAISPDEIHAFRQSNSSSDSLRVRYRDRLQDVPLVDIWQRHLKQTRANSSKMTSYNAGERQAAATQTTAKQHRKSQGSPRNAASKTKRGKPQKASRLAAS